ncbi:probable protein phosphatase 2C 33 [Gossypium raimondii]|uniref:probable protein phosphatase 2C 33 n=1 Tax=Gossypium raimondii TaxID=29730 RepID=UPI00227C3069|nr:probable protein phosphatase 2C 33 [Gossypium raimondii]
MDSGCNTNIANQTNVWWWAHRFGGNAFLFSPTKHAIWDVLSNKEVIDIIESALACSSAARTLLQTAVRAWRYKYLTSKADDCAVVIIRFSVATHEL